MIFLLLFIVLILAFIMFTYFIIESVIPYFIRRYNQMQDQRTAKISAQLEESFIFWEKKRLMLVYFSPLIFSGLGFILFKHIVAIGFGFLLGLIFPGLMVKFSYGQRMKKFQSQLVDAMMILSSSLKAGLSFIQAIEVLCEEMPPPISQEFKLVLKENKWGLSLEESLVRFRKRIPLEEVNLLVSSILIARETGGELSKVLLRLTTTIRDNLKLKEKIGTLTLQGRLQGYIMMALPIAFGYFVFKQNPEHFMSMWQNETGRLLLIVAAGLQVAGMVAIQRISRMKV